MKLLAIESSSLVASVAIVNDDILTAEYTINHKVTHSQTLLPMIDEICKMTQTNPKDFDAIAISGGPGSFTGLRIGSATAKGLGLAIGVPLIHVPTLKAMAYNIYGTDKLVCPIMDARRQQVYTGAYSFEDGGLVTYIEDCAIAFEELIGRLNKMNKKTIFVGDGIPVFVDYIKENATFEYEFAPAGMNRQRASSVAVLGMEYYRLGKTVSADEHLPEYFRMSQAERERLEKVETNEHNNNLNE